MPAVPPADAAGKRAIRLLVFDGLIEDGFHDQSAARSAGQMAKIFNISLHRSGTSSFAIFCGRNGLSWQHWPGEEFDRACSPALSRMDLDFVWNQYRPLLDGTDAFADLPVPFLYRQAYAEFPDAKFVLIKRPVLSWIKSVRQHCGNRRLDTLEQFQYRFISGKTVSSLDELADRELFFGYENFIETALNHLSGVGASFLLIDLHAPDLSKKVNAFLGFDGRIDFPKVNAA